MITIEQAAILVLVGKAGGVLRTLPRPNRHADILSGPGPWSPRVEGFMTSEGTFVDRAQAYKIAEAAGQIIESFCWRRQEEDPSYTFCPGTLYTEDLW